MFVKQSKEVAKEKVQNGTRTYKQVLIGSDQGPHFAMRRFIIQAGGEMPLHTNTVEHEQFVLAGRAKVVIGEKTYSVKKNDVVFIPAGVRHSYTVVGSVAFEFLCVVPNEKDLVELVT
jgi:quercetin dioxygenase-like cupin family protein